VALRYASVVEAMTLSPARLEWLAAKKQATVQHRKEQLARERALEASGKRLLEPTKRTL
jgi:hypothetical protein